MPGINTLTHIVYCICNSLKYDSPNLTESEQYEAQLNELLKEENLVKEIIFKEAMDIVDEEEYRKYLAHIFRGLAAFENMLECKLAGEKADKDSSVVCLQQQALSVIKRLTIFFLDHFPDAKAKNTVNPVLVQRFKLPVSVAAMAALTKAVVKSTGVPDGMAAEIIRFIIRHFSSMNTDEIAYDSFRKHYDKPEEGAASQIITILGKMIAYLKKV
jgi:hypothetical protein